MRITTQMLNMTARKSGVMLNTNSLLNYINDNSHSNILNSINAGTMSTSAINARIADISKRFKKNSYEELDDAAELLTDNANKLAHEGEDNIFAKAKAGGNNKLVYDTVKLMINGYNNILDELNKINNPLNIYYGSMLKEVSGDSVEDLKRIGITINKSGKLSINEKTFMAADIDVVENILGNKSEFMTKTAFVASRISNNAKANIESLSNTYDSSCSFYSILNSMYDTKG